MIDYVAWLKDRAAVRIALVEVTVKTAGLETTRFLSTGAYTTSATDSPANQYYQPIILAGLQITEQLDIDGESSFTVGDIEISNINGERDDWLDDVWDNRSIKVWIGDPSWVRADFQMIFNGIVATIDSKSRDVLNLSIRDKLQRLNTPVTDQKIGGTGANKGDVISLSFGEVSNITPQLTSGGALEYQVHNGAIERLIEVRDNGKPVPVTEYLSTGRFVLTRPSAGAITASVQGDKSAEYGYPNTISKLVQRIATGFGNATDRFTVDDLDLTNLNEFDTACPQPVGVCADGRTTVISLCRSLASSVDARLVMSRLGKLRLIQIKIPGNGTPVAIGEDNMIERSLKIHSRPLVKASIMLGFNKNWEVQDALLTTIPDAHKRLFAKEWLTTTATSATVQADYKLNAAPVQSDTMLCRRVDAEAEAQRRLDVRATPRTVFQFEGTADLLASVELGGAVTLTHKRFGLSEGKPGIIVSLSPNWFSGRVTVGVMV